MGLLPRLPYARPRLIELHEQPYFPTFLRQPIQTMLTAVWVTRFRPFQSLAPYEAVSDVLEGVVDAIEAEDRVDAGINGEGGREGKRGRMRIVDCCSGAGGPMFAIERRLNEHRQYQCLPPIPVLLTDLHPHLSAWSHLTSLSPSKSLSYLPYPVDATRAPELLSKERHFRTFCLAFHHFDEQGARAVIEDAMRTADGIGIFELQEFDLGSLATVSLLFPFCLLLTPFHRPSLTTLIFTYLIPIVPLILVLDGYVSAYRTRSFPHIMHLANQASMAVSLERGGGGNEGTDEVEWKWESGRRVHTWPFGVMSYVVGRRDRS